MFTDRKLTNAYKDGLVINFDSSAKFIFFSDCHRGDDSVSDEFSRNQIIFLGALEYYYSHGYTYVEVGDGDDLWEHKHFKHIRLAHYDVFSVLKKLYEDGRFILLYGNHNIFLKNPKYVCSNYYHYYDEYYQEKVELFKDIKPIEALVLRYKKTDQEIFVIHGHQGDFMNDQFWLISKFLLRYFWRFMHLVGFQNPSSPARNYYKRHKVERNYKKWILRHKKMLICGHTHRPKFPKLDELPYFNTGSCINTRGISGIEIVDGHILMVEWRIRPDKHGTLHLDRHVKRGPEPIETFDCNNKDFKYNVNLNGDPDEDC